MTRAARLIHMAACVAALAAAGSVQAANIEPTDRPVPEPACKSPIQDVLNSATDQSQPARRATANGPAVRDDFRLIFHCPAGSEPTT